MTKIPATALQIRSLVTSDRQLRLSLEQVDVPQPRADQVLVRVEAAPINPSDLGLLLAGADITTATAGGTVDAPVVTAEIPEPAFASLRGRVGVAMPVGNEGAGVVVAAGSSSEAQALVGRTVGVLGGSMYSQYRCLNVGQCLVLSDTTTSEQGASCFVNPLTALGMVATMRNEGHRALVRTAAASNLGQMLNKLCLADGVALVNIVRRPEQESLLRSLGATLVCTSTSPSFRTDLIAALRSTGATLGFDAIGGGTLCGEILSCMEAASDASAAEYSRYGSATHKQVYIYGGLDRSPTQLARKFGMAWGVGGWLLTAFLDKAGRDETERLRHRVANEITTTFSSTYTARVTLPEALSLDAITAYARQATGEKFLITPHG